MRNQQVVDEFTTSPVDTREALALWDQQSQVPQPLPVALVRLVEPTRANLRAGRAVQELRSGGLRLIVEITSHDDGAVLTVSGEEVGGVGTDGGCFSVSVRDSRAVNDRLALPAGAGFRVLTATLREKNRVSVR